MMFALRFLAKIVKRKNIFPFSEDRINLVEGISIEV